MFLNTSPVRFLCPRHFGHKCGAKVRAERRKARVRLVGGWCSEGAKVPPSYLLSTAKYLTAWCRWPSCWLGEGAKPKLSITILLLLRLACVSSPHLHPQNLQTSFSSPHRILPAIFQQTSRSLPTLLGTSKKLIPSSHSPSFLPSLLDYIEDCCRSIRYFLLPVLSCPVLSNQKATNPKDTTAKPPPQPQKLFHCLSPSVLSPAPAPHRITEIGIQLRRRLLSHLHPN